MIYRETAVSRSFRKIPDMMKKVFTPSAFMVIASAVLWGTYGSFAIWASRGTR